MIEKILEIEILLSHARDCVLEAIKNWQSVSPDKKLDVRQYACFLYLGFVLDSAGQQTESCLSGVMQLRHDLELSKKGECEHQFERVSDCQCGRSWQECKICHEERRGTPQEDACESVHKEGIGG